MKSKDEFTWVLVLVIVVVFLAAGLIEPCDSHSCN